MTNEVLDKELHQVWQTLSGEQKASVLQLLNAFKENEATMTAEEIADYNVEIAEAEQRINAGEYYTQSEVKNILKKW